MIGVRVSLAASTVREIDTYTCLGRGVRVSLAASTVREIDTYTCLDRSEGKSSCLNSERD